MRKVAAYVLETTCAPLELENSLKAIADEVLDWLHSKGTIHHGESASSLELPAGDFADLKSETIATRSGRLYSWVLTEYPEGTQFRTSIDIGGLGDSIVVRCVLEVGGYGDAISPLSFDARTPHIVRRLLNRHGARWTFAGEPVPNQNQVFHGRDGGDRFAELVMDQRRAFPIVAISQDQGVALHPDLGRMLAYDLAALAIVAELDPSASWRLTERVKREWSVYGGAIRVYWPRPNDSDDPFAHRLWTPRRLLEGVSGVEEAVERIRRQLRRGILSASAFSVPEPRLILEIRRQARREELDDLRARVEEGGDYKAAAEHFLERIVKLEEERDSQDDVIADLREQLRNLQEALRYYPQHYALEHEVAGDVPAETEAPPATLQEAVMRAKERFADHLIFGADVWHGITTLSPDAGPPSKVMDYLEALADLAEHLRAGPLGDSIVGWLKSRGVNASLESETVNSSPRERAKRTWDNGKGERMYFELHLKPNDATTPDRCVRIYVDAEVHAGKVIVGWVGRHP